MIGKLRFGKIWNHSAQPFPKISEMQTPHKLLSYPLPRKPYPNPHPAFTSPSFSHFRSHPHFNSEQGALGVFHNWAVGSIGLTLMDIKAVKMAARYEQIAGAKVNWKQWGCLEGSVPLLEPFHWSDVRILGMWLEPGLQLGGNWWELQAKAEELVETWLQRHLFSRTSSPWSFTGYMCFPGLKALGWRCNDSSTSYCGDVETQWSVDRSVINVLAMLD